MEYPITVMEDGDREVLANHVCRIKLFSRTVHYECILCDYELVNDRCTLKDVEIIDLKKRNLRVFAFIKDQPDFRGPIGFTAQPMSEKLLKYILNHKKYSCVKH